MTTNSRRPPRQNSNPQRYSPMSRAKLLLLKRTKSNQGSPRPFNTVIFAFELLVQRGQSCKSCARWRRQLTFADVRLSTCPVSVTRSEVSAQPLQSGATVGESTTKQVVLTAGPDRSQNISSTRGYSPDRADAWLHEAREGRIFTSDRAREA